MKKVILVIISLAIILCLASSCIFSSSPFVGTWKNGNDTLKFLENGEVIYVESNSTYSGTYRVIDDEYIKFTFTGLGGTLFNAFGDSTFRYQIVTIKLTLSNGPAGHSATYTKQY